VYVSEKEKSKILCYPNALQYVAFITGTGTGTERTGSSIGS
jgi:hypothetical protein